ncbi:hypothetical protein POVWA1_026150 [Plasmodium ovale wallikeri]|uniref:Uncharacterized protein n=1 Tax=Plasmodium ovale wallikeri TaxID=864142 RepID=A0A1A8YUG6_PLAOA|nr:hypothetical protein POVWA1_026150 [Plasmodium ovale wallikeri]
MDETCWSEQEPLSLKKTLMEKQEEHNNEKKERNIIKKKKKKKKNSYRICNGDPTSIPHFYVTLWDYIK